MDLIQQLVKNLGVDESQAKGGLGLLLKLASDRLPQGDFSKIAEVIPESKDCMDNAPDTSGGVLGAVGGLVSSFGGKGKDLGALAGLAQGFKSLNLDSEMVQKFASMVIDYLKANGGEAVAGIVEGFLKQGKES